MSAGAVTVAAAQYPVEFIESWEHFQAKVTAWIDEAASAGATLLVFPEYFSIEITAIFGADVYGSLPRQLDALQDTLPDFLALFAGLARRYGVHVLAGSYPVRVGDAYHNRAYFFWPDGRHAWQEKLQMTRFENELWRVASGTGLAVFDCAFGKVAVNVCYDSEFPLLARRQVEQGADLILVPSCTDSLAGFNRVRIGCQARALENQCFVVQSPTIGDCAWSEAIDTNVGFAAVYTPVDRGFPSDGVLAQGPLNQPQWVVVELDLAHLAHVRANGQVFNHRDWDGQWRHLGERVG
ncbi:MAG: carbon-nitrogen hydrolase family protein [Gammaproteobacteria bacterium]